jgi:EAL domain-containing protein (putative c-di-GMP-specific phosphodiesterase class I)
VIDTGNELRTAIERGEIQPYFQPTVDLRSGRVTGTEALARWIHPQRGPIAPDEFLALAEARGEMRALTERVIEFSTTVAGDWWRSGLGLQLSVNLPASAIADSDWDLGAFVAEALSRTGLPSEALQFEVTENALMADAEAAASTLGRLSGVGTRIAIDDFGTGLSAVSRLISLPIDEIKVDRSFIGLLTESDDYRTVVRSSIYMAHQMGLGVVAEGVETEDAWRQLRSMGCERAQGFLISEPLPAREVPAWLASWNQRARELRSISRGLQASGPGAQSESAKAPA